jgi:O-antigen/teichoic acid export membrane protein
MAMRRGKSLTEQAAVLFVGHVLALLIGVAVPMVLVRIFPQEQYGLYQQLFLIFTTLLPFGQMGVTQGLYYFLPREPEKKDAVVAQTFLFVIMTGAFCSFGLLLFRTRIATFMNSPEMVQYLPIVSLFVFFMIVSSFMETLMIAEGQARLSSIVRVCSELFRSLAVILTAFVTRNILSVFMALTCFSLLRCLFQGWYLFGRYRMFTGGIDFVFWKRQLSYSIPIGMGNVAWLVQMRMHSFFVTFLVAPAVYAIYAVGTYNLPFVSLISSSVSSVMVPELARCQKDGDTTRVLSVWAGSLRKMNLIFFPLFTFFFIIAHDFIVLLFTEQYVGSVSIFRISLFGILISGINTGAILNAYAETRYQMWMALIKIPVVLVVLYFLTRAWGIHGAVAADVLVSVSLRFVELFKVTKVMDVSFWSLLRPGENLRIMAAAFFAVIPVITVQYYLAMSPFFMLMLNAVIFLLSFSIAGFGLKIVTRSEIDSLKGAILPRFCSGKYPL